MSVSAGVSPRERARLELRSLVRRAFTPVSAYRLQLSREFPLARAEAALPYLRDLGVDAVYLSPVLRAAPGSAHGYDVADPSEISPELGGAAGFERFCARLRRERMALILDIVPNHMGVSGGANPFWNDVLESGPDSRYARFFDIDWDPGKPELRGKVLLPVLGDLYGRVLESGGLSLEFEAGRFRLRWPGGTLPIRPSTWARILSPGRPAFSETRPRAAGELAAALARAAAGDGEAAARRLASLYRRSRAFRALVEESLEGHRVPQGAERLHDLLEAQAYRLAHWRAASDEINYRRFFAINELAAVRPEDPEVFDALHRLIFRLIDEGKVQGLRIDHPDGLYDPPRYFSRVQDRFLADRLRGRGLEREAEGLLGDPEFASSCPLFVVAEKILDRKEPLPEDWRVRGTVGYDALNLLNGLFVDRAREAQVDAAYRAFTGAGADFGQLTYDAKKRFAKAALAGDLERLGWRLDRISEGSRVHRDFTRASLTRALGEILDSFPVYRTYVSLEASAPTARDERYIRIAVERAKAANPQLLPEVFDFVRDVLLLRLEPALSPEDRALYRDFVLRFQQLTAPVMAKGLEDTAFYVDARLLSLNEVGGDPAHFGVSRGEFHRQSAERAKRWPSSFTTTATHDTKRGEDARLRIDAISELVEEWTQEVSRWALVNDKHKTELDGVREPRRSTEYFLYQTLVGVWPEEEMDAAGLERLRGRLRGYALKSIREAKMRTDWVSPDTEYEAAVRRFLDGLLEGGAEGPFLRLFLPFQRKAARIGRLSSLSCLTLKLAGPGVADTYQGTELWSLTLVDPDNRAPVDFERLAGLAAGLDAELASGRERVLRRWAEEGDPRLKLFILREGLRLRRRLRGLFVGGEYAELKPEGPAQERLVALGRRDGRRVAAAVAARFFARPGGWEATTLALPDWLCGRRLRDAYTGRVVEARQALRAEEVLETLPCALLVGDED